MPLGYNLHMFKHLHHYYTDDEPSDEFLPPILLRHSHIYLYSLSGTHSIERGESTASYR